MTPEKKKLLLFGGGAAALTLLVYFIFFNKKKTANPNPSPNPLPKPKPKPKPPINEDPEYSEYEEIEEEEIEQVTTRSGTRLREKPLTNSTIIKTYQSGVKLTVIGSEEMLDGTWYEILSPRGYVRSDVVD